MGHGVPSVAHAYPAQHPSQAVAPAPEKYLGGHFSGMPVPCMAQMDPLGQLRHCEKPPSAYRPTGHGVIVPPSGHSYPCGHGLGSVVDGASHSDPGGHAVQFSCVPAHTHSILVPVLRPSSVHC